MHPMGLRGSSSAGFVRVVRGPVWKNRMARSQQPDVCRAIPLHNYLPDIRDLRAPPASERRLCLFSLLSHHCPLSQDHFSLLVAIAFLSPLPHTVLLWLAPPALRVRIHYFIPPHSLCCGARCQKTCILLSFFPFVAPPASAHTFPVPIIFYFLFPPPLQLVATLLFSSLPCLLRFVPPSLVIPFDSCQNITPSPGANNTRAYLLFK